MILSCRVMWWAAENAKLLWKCQRWTKTSRWPQRSSEGPSPVRWNPLSSFWQHPSSAVHGSSSGTFTVGNKCYRRPWGSSEDASHILPQGCRRRPIAALLRARPTGKEWFYVAWSRFTEREFTELGSHHGSHLLHLQEKSIPLSCQLLPSTNPQPWTVLTWFLSLLHCTTWMFDALQSPNMGFTSFNGWSQI